MNNQLARCYGRAHKKQVKTAEVDVGSTVSSIKKKLGETPKSKNNTLQINELLYKMITYYITILIQEMNDLDIKLNTGL